MIRFIFEDHKWQGRKKPKENATGDRCEKKYNYGYAYVFQQKRKKQMDLIVSLQNTYIHEITVPTRRAPYNNCLEKKNSKNEVRHVMRWKRD